MELGSLLEPSPLKGELCPLKGTTVSILRTYAMCAISMVGGMYSIKVEHFDVFLVTICKLNELLLQLYIYTHKFLKAY